MAHLPDDSLPSQFDVVVNGTGLVQSLLAAAASRAGKSVLHIDGNSYYGELWGTLMHRELDDWIGGASHELSHDAPDTLPELAAEERLIVIKQPSRDCQVSNIVQTVHEKPRAKPEPDPASESSSDQTPASPNDQGSPLDGSTQDPPPSDGASQPDSTPPPPPPPPPPQSERVSWESLGQLRKRFNYDISAKLLYCRGAMVSVLTESSCSRYVEFKAVKRVYTLSNGRPEQVPCSRADVFSSQVVSMLEKRKMMKFLTFCSDFDKHPEEYEELVSVPFAEFLRLKDLTQNLIQYIVHSIAMVTEDTPTLQGLQATRLFLNSLGRFGNAPFLYPIFGVGELPQAFCRMSAVFGGVYCLRRRVQSLVVAGDTVTGIVCSHGQKISCSSVITSAALVKDSLNLGESVSVLNTSHGVFVTDGPIENTHDTLALLTIPPYSLGSGHTSTIRCLQLDSSTQSTVEGTYMVHMACTSQQGSAQKDLQLAAQTLFRIEDLPESNSSGPRLLWSLCYDLSLASLEQGQTEEEEVAALELPSGIYLTSDPDPTMGFEAAVKEARLLFERLCPGEPFLPPPPEQEEIIVGEVDGEGEDPAEEGDNEAQGDNVPVTGDVPVVVGDVTTPEGAPVVESANELQASSDEAAENNAQESANLEATPPTEVAPDSEGDSEPQGSSGATPTAAA